MKRMTIWIVGGLIVGCSTVRAAQQTVNQFLQDTQQAIDYTHHDAQHEQEQEKEFAQLKATVEQLTADLAALQAQLQGQFEQLGADGAAFQERVQTELVRIKTEIAALQEQYNGQFAQLEVAVATLQERVQTVSEQFEARTAAIEESVKSQVVQLETRIAAVEEQEKRDDQDHIALAQLTGDVKALLARVVAIEKQYHRNLYMVGAIGLASGVVASGLIHWATK